MSTEERIKPKLLALLICEKTFLDEDKVATLMRLIDTFNFTVEGSRDTQLGKLAVPVHCVLFTKWGLGKGEFTDEVRIIKPNGDVMTANKTGFKLPGGFCFHQIRRVMHLNVTEAGEFSFHIYLDNEFVAQHPFKVNIDHVQPLSGSLKPPPEPAQG
ncbi:MAG: hypothetical protein Q7T26_11175 [Dehalococcoidia bacterium]|nr:hypothetical protein [Dehalococcoidia bacterium]